MHTLSYFLLCFVLVLVKADDTVDSGEPAPDFTVADLENVEKVDHKFQAEINQLMGIIVNSLYSNRDIFVRELVSNAADALDKIRYVNLIEEETLPEALEYEIKIRIDHDNDMIHIRDTGIGMTKEDLINNLGSIAKSGTTEFIKKMETGSEDLTQIGQFGVGFYSSFLVADKVTVTTKNNKDDQYIWESTMDESTAYSIAKDPRGNTLGRGTLISLHMREDATEYMSTTKLTQLIQHYNQFVTFPIYIWESHEEEIPVVEPEVVEKVDEVDEEGELEEDGIDIEVEDELEEEVAPAVPEKKTVWEWEQLNSVQPLWKRSKSEITDEEYEQFYTDSIDMNSKPLKWSHFKAEGDIEFTALLYVPISPPAGSTDFQNAHSEVKLYVKRVFISDSFEEFLPIYLNFVRGVVDSDDLPLNVSREMLQQNKILQTIQKKLIRKIIALLQNIMDGDDWETFYEKYHQFIKMGVIRDPTNKNRLAKLLRFYSSKHVDERISFEEYVEEMKEGQEEIYFLAGENNESLLNSPLIERISKKGFNVLLFPDPIDEYLALNMRNYDGKYQLVDLGKEGLKLDEEDKQKQTTFKEEFEPLISYLKTTLEKSVSSVAISMRLSTSPCALISTAYGMSANFERIMKAQALADKSQMNGVGAKKIFEINPRHPIMRHLLDTVENKEQNQSTDDLVKMLYDSATLVSGYSLEDPVAMAERLNKLVAASLEISDDEEVEEEIFPVEEVKDSDDDDEDDEEADGEDGEEADSEEADGEEADGEDSEEADEPGHVDL